VSKDFSPIAITSANVGFPARIVVITRTDGEVRRFAESDETIIVDGDPYLVIPGTQISAIKQTSNGEMPSCQIAAVSGDGFTFDSEEIDIGLYSGATVEIYKVDRKNLTRKGLEFTGAISTVTTDPIDHQVVFDVKGPASAAGRLITQKRAPMCRTDLYSVLCQVDKTAYDVATTVATIPTAFSFTVTGSLAQATNYFNQGVLLTANGRKLEIAAWHQPTQTINTYLACNRLLTVGLGLTLYPGCDKTDGINGCGKFSNWINFQGENHWLGAAASAQQA
jgi:uncharacterized phage protein (TIGR02218 family)